MMMSMLAGLGKLEIEALPGKDQILVPWLQLLPERGPGVGG